MKLGMPILFEYQTVEENLILAKSLGLDFIELNLNFEYCRREMEGGALPKLFKKYGLFATLHFYDEGDFASYGEVTRAYLSLFKKIRKARSQIRKAYKRTSVWRTCRYDKRNEKLYL